MNILAYAVGTAIGVAVGYIILIIYYNIKLTIDEKIRDIRWNKIKKGLGETYNGR